MKRHPTDLVALVAGLLFMGAGFFFLSGAEVRTLSPDWVLPAILVGIGLLVAVTTLGLTTRSSARAKDEISAEGS